MRTEQDILAEAFTRATGEEISVPKNGHILKTAC